MSRSAYIIHATESSSDFDSEYPPDKKGIPSLPFKMIDIEKLADLPRRLRRDTARLDLVDQVERFGAHVTQKFLQGN